MINRLVLFSLTCLIFFTSCSRSKSGFRVAATPVPHAQMLEFIKPDLEAQGIHLVIVITEDYNIPNRALADKDVAANFFQHAPFMEAQIKQFGYAIESLAKIEIDSAMLPRTLQDVAAAVINTNYALEANLNPLKDALALESKDSLYANIIAVRKEDSQTFEIEALKVAMTSDKMKEFILEKYKGSVIPAF